MLLIVGCFTHIADFINSQSYLPHSSVSPSVR